MTREFEGKAAIVTGGGSGIGAAVCRQLAEAGARVVVADLAMDDAQAVASGIKDGGGEAEPYEIDVTDATAVKEMVEFATGQFGGLHLAVNNAGIGGASAPTADQGLDDWHKVVDVNLHAVFYCMKYEIPAMLAAGGGAIVNMASILGGVGFAHASAYVAAKHGVVGLTRSAAIEYAAQGVRINAVGPGFIDTPLLSKNLDQAALDHVTGLHPIGRLGRPEEVAALTLFLLSDRASFVTGSYHLVDGAYAAQ